ncbi:hypothetical protein [Derxia gummosa]|uniref:Uncharacterized protein n=1 Tax=Derxia gummosa DSM 723 TaxID=1121388 RepID=A0A8B6X2T4_9BURK|nr:hypothetical protein [Derxia gummosa]
MSALDLWKVGRRCSNCQAFETEASECLNGLGVMQPDGVCEQHRSIEESKADDEAMQRFRSSIGLPPMR